MKYIVNEIIFNSKKELSDYIKNIINNYSRGMNLNKQDFEFIKCLFENHPKYYEKSGCGIKNIQVRFNGINSNEFYIVREDGTSIDISWHKCIMGDSNLAILKKVARNEVAFYVIEFKKNSFKDNYHLKCPISGDVITYHTSHVDHENKFDLLFNEFFKKIDINKFEFIDNRGSDKKFKDRILAEKWIDFHNTNAKLRVVSIKTNLSTLEIGKNCVPKHRTGGILPQ